MMLYTFESGSPEQPAIVFLHGGGLSYHMWQPVIERLPGYHCLAPDLPEHGQSRDIQPFDLEDSARRVVEVIHARVPSHKAHLVGLSLGGAVAMTIARLAPETCDHVMVSGTSAVLSKFLANLSLASLWMLRMYKPRDLVKASIKQFGIPERYKAMFEEDLMHSNTEAFNRTLIENLMRQQLPEQMCGPLLVTVGEKETIPAKQAAQKLTRLYAGAVGKIVPGMGHVWALQDPDRFAATVGAWVSDLPLPTDLRPI